MQRRVFLLLGLILALPAMTKASTISAQGGPVVNLLPNTAGQTVTLLISGGDFYQFGDFFALINGGTGPAPAVETVFGDNLTTIPAANLAGSVWAGGAGGIGSPPNGTTFDSPGLNPLVSLATAGNASVNTEGVYLTMTVTTVGVPAGQYFVDLSATTLSNGLDGDLEPIPTPLDAQSFTLSIVPEPSSIVMGLFAAAGLAAVVIRRRRAA